MVLSKNNFNKNLVLFTNLVFAFFPISFVFGNLFINLNLLLFCSLGIFHLRLKILKIKYDFPIKIIFLFFLLILFSTSLNFLKISYTNGYEYENLVPLLKSILFFRFFLMLIIVYLLVKFDFLNFKYFFILAAFFPVLISIDVIYQYFFGFNIIGLEGFQSNIHPLGKYNSSFFGDELIAGSYIKNFSLFSIFFLAFKFKNKYNIRFILLTATICILGFGILTSGNRMPVPLFLLGLLLIFFFKYDLKKIISVSIVFLVTIFYFTISFDEEKYWSYYSFYGNFQGEIIEFYNQQTNKQKKNVSKTKKLQHDDFQLEDDFQFFWIYNPSQAHGHVKLYYTAVDLWEKNKIFGNGIKSFRVGCRKLEAHTMNRLCSTHPHNYYIEILAETGAAGLFIVVAIGLLFFIFIFKNFKFFHDNNKVNFILLAATISLLVEAFPIKSTGSIFTTSNATYMILIGSIVLSDKRLLNV